MTSQLPRLSFEQFFSASEAHRWNMERDLPWNRIRRDLVTDEELETLRHAAVVEGYTPRYAADLVPLFVDEPEMSAFFSVQHYEEFKHFHALRRYLRLCGVEVCEQAAQKSVAVGTEYSGKLVVLLKFGLSEIFTAIFYREISRQTREPVLKQLAKLISMDEYRHLAWYQSYLKWYVVESAITGEQISKAVCQYQHQGLDAIQDWVEHWNYSGRRYTGWEPYRHIRRLLRELVGHGVDLGLVAKRTSAAAIASPFR